MEYEIHADELKGWLGERLFKIWADICTLVEARYTATAQWQRMRDGKQWKAEYKFRCGSKTLCGLYAAENRLGFMIIFGAAEREKAEKIKNFLIEKTRNVYDEAATYHDGKWVMFQPTDESQYEDFVALLRVKRRPDRKIEA